MQIADDKFNRTTHYTRYQGVVATEYRPDGYYWAFPIHGSEGGYSAWCGPFPTRQEAKEASTAKKKS